MRTFNIARLPFFRIVVFIVIAAAGLLSLWETYLFLWLKTRIIADGSELSVHYRPVTVGKFLKQNGIAVGDKDIVEPPVTMPVPKTKPIRVVRVTEKDTELTEELPFKVIGKERFSANLRPVELQKGIMRSKKRRAKLVYHDGREVACVLVRELETRKTVYRLVLLSEKGGMEKIYDLSRAKKMKMVATAYYPGDPLAWRDGTITFLGQKMQRGIVAVDPRVIPLRTRVYVPGYGYGYAGDTGSAIKGMRIDLGVNNAEEEKSFMHKPVTVYILEKSRTW